jgi:preprotein translocase subunit SecE
LQVQVLSPLPELNIEQSWTLDGGHPKTLTERHAVSDEREGAGAAGDGDETTPGGGQTAVATRPLRPTGKRSRAATTADEDTEQTTETKGGVTKNGAGTKVRTAKKRSGPSPNPFVYLWTYLGQVVAELRKVIWPNRKQMISYTTVVLFFLAFMVTLIGLVDLGLAKLVLLVFG